MSYTSTKNYRNFLIYVLNIQFGVWVSEGRTCRLPQFTGKLKPSSELTSACDQTFPKKVVKQFVEIHLFGVFPTC
jgi:hypothetical protein